MMEVMRWVHRTAPHVEFMMMGDARDVTRRMAGAVVVVVVVVFLFLISYFYFYMPYMDLVVVVRGKEKDERKK